MSLIAPREANGFIPHILRARWFLALGFLALWSMYVSVKYSDVLRQETFSAAVVEAEVVAHTNAQRLADNVAALRVNPLLAEAARLKAEDMVTKGYFAHVSPTGEGAWSFLSYVNYQYEYAGENLAVNFGSADEVVRAWMLSPSHRANLLNGRFNEIGIAAAEGWYKGKPATFVVQMFGRNMQPLLPILASDGEEVVPAPSEGANFAEVVRQAGAQALSALGDPRTIAALPMVIVSILVLAALMTFPSMRKKHRIGALLSGIGLIGFSMILLAVSQYVLMPVIL